jgi:hypothetical protein
MPPRTGTTLAWRGNRKAHSPMTSQAMLSQLTVAHPVTPAMVPGYRQLLSWEWPSLLYALDIIAWDLFRGLALLFAAPVFSGGRLQAGIRVGLIIGGLLCLARLAGPAIGFIALRYVAALRGGRAAVGPAIAVHAIRPGADNPALRRSRPVRRMSVATALRSLSPPPGASQVSHTEQGSVPAIWISRPAIAWATSG